MKSPCFKVWLGGLELGNGSSFFVTKWHLHNPSRFIAKEKVRQKLKDSLELQYILFTGKTRNKPLQAYFLRHTLILQFLEHFTKAIIKGTFSCNNLVRRPIYIMNSVDTPKISFFHTLPPPPSKFI